MTNSAPRVGSLHYLCYDTLSALVYSFSIHYLDYVIDLREGCNAEMAFLCKVLEFITAATILDGGRPLKKIL